MARFVGANKFVLEFIDFAVEIVFPCLVLGDIGLETFDGRTSLLFRGLEFGDTRFHEIVDEFKLHYAAS